MLLHTSEAARSGPVDSVDKKLQVKSLEHAATLRWQPYSSTQEVPGEIAGQSGFQDFMISGQRRFAVTNVHSSYSTYSVS